MTTAGACVGIGEAFGNLSMEAILSCGVPRTLNKIWETTSKLNAIGEAASKELSVENVNMDK